MNETDSAGHVAGSPSRPGRFRASAVVRRILVGLALGGGAAAIAALLSQVDLFHRFENTSYDWRVRQTAVPVPSDTPIVIVEINESSIRAMEPLVGRWPWPRVVHASAIDYMARAGAKVIAYDVLFLEHEGRSETVIGGQRLTGDQSDQALITSVSGAGNVLLLAEATYEGLAREASDAPSTALLPGVVYEPGSGFQSRRVTLPFAELAGVATGVGHNFLQKDPGSDFARRMLPFVDATGVAVPSLGVAAALAYQAIDSKQVIVEGRYLRVGDARLPLLDVPAMSSDARALPSKQALLRFRSTTPHPDGSTSVFPTYSMFDVLLSADQLASGREPVVPRSTFAGKLVFVGTSAAGTYDSYATPFSDNAPGVELHATMADNLLSRQFMRRASPSTDVALIVAAAIVTGVAATVLPAVWGSVAVVVLTAAFVVGLVRAVGDGLWIAAVAPLTGVGLALFGGVAWQYVVEGRGKREMRRLFGRYVSKDVIEQLTDNPSMAVLGGQRRTMSVLFSDIRGFTAASEHGEPEAIVAQLNEYFGAMVEVLFEHQGTLDKFVGDMVMGLFGAPIPDARHADHAVAAALEMTSRLATLNARWKTEGKPALDIGIGINSGEMIAGNIGSEAIMSYTVIGDAVNLGARLESLNKDYGSRILISQATRDALTTTVATRLIGPVVVKGRQQPVMVYEVPTTEHSA